MKITNNIGHSNTRKALLEISSNKSMREIDLNYLNSFCLLLKSDLNEITTSSIQKFTASVDDFSAHNTIALTKAQTIRYTKSQPEYFTPKEALIVGLNMKFHQTKSTSIKSHHITKYLDYAAAEESSYKNIANANLGLYYFDEAMEKDGKRRRSSLKKALSCFLSCLNNGLSTSFIITKVGIIHGLLGKLDAAIKFLLKGARLADNPYFHYAFISKIYSALNMVNAKIFYSRKADRFQSQNKLLAA